MKIKEIKDCVKTLQNDQPVTQECLLIIRLEGKLVPFSKVMVRSVYQELQKESVYNESYKQKCETTVKDTLGGGGGDSRYFRTGVCYFMVSISTLCGIFDEKVGLFSEFFCLTEVSKIRF